METRDSGLDGSGSPFGRNGGTAPQGVFATPSPDRPNPPVLDLKPALSTDAGERRIRHFRRNR